MKIKILNGLILVNILSILLLLIIYLIPESIIRIILGLPFILYFPGYALTSAIFSNKNEMESLERFTISCGMSIAIVGIIGFGLNYTQWGIRLEPVLFSITILIILVSSIALIRQAFSIEGVKYFSELVIKIPRWQVSTFSKTFTIVLAVCIVAAIGVLCYVVAFPKIEDKFTELYILGLNGKAQDYPSEFYLKNGQVDSVGYGEALLDTVNKWGRITVGIVNHEGEMTKYYISSNINDEEVLLRYQDDSISKIGPIILGNGEKWEGGIGIIPQKAGGNQKVEIQLYNDNGSTPMESVHIWIDVKELQ